MSYRYTSGVAREQGLLLPRSLEEYIAEDNPVRAIDAYVESLDLAQLGFQHTGGCRLNHLGFTLGDQFAPGLDHHVHLTVCPQSPPLPSCLVPSYRTQNCGTP